MASWAGGCRLWVLFISGLAVACLFIRSVGAAVGVIRVGSFPFKPGVAEPLQPGRPGFLVLLPWWVRGSVWPPLCREGEMSSPTS